MHNCGHNHTPTSTGNAPAVVQFQPVHIALPGRFDGMHPYMPVNLTLLQQADSFVLEGHYGYELCAGHQFVVTVGGEERTYTRWEDIPQRIGRVRRFQPGTDPHDVDFTVHYTVDGQPRTFIQNVHQEAGGWVARLQELTRREGGA